MFAQQLYDDFRNYLKVTTSIPPSSYPGDFLEVPEKFKLRVMVQNTAPTGNQHPMITFRNVRVTVIATQYASPIDANNNDSKLPVMTVPLGDPVLTRQDSGFVEIDMQATGAMPWYQPAPERITIVTVQADVDQNDFFKIYESVDVYHNINAD